MQVGERLLLCSDGLTEALEESDLERLLQLPVPPVALAEKLIRQAVSQGSQDNISVLVGVAS